MLLRRPGFTLVAVITLALGIGANTAIFSVVNTVLLRPLPYEEPERLVMIWETNLKSGIKEEPASIPNFSDWREQSQAFEAMGAFATSLPILSSGTGEPERIQSGIVSAGFFSTLRAKAALGRTFLAEENQPEKNRVVVLSYALWQRRFGADPNIIGQSLTLNGNAHTIVGVMPADFQHPAPNTRRDLWTPLAFNPQAGRRSDFLRVIARLKPGVALERAQAEMSAIARGLEQQYPGTNAGWSVNLVLLHEQFVGKVRLALIVLLGAVGFLLLIACANVANLLLARATARQKEIAVRAALGAGRGRLIRQLLTESVLLASVGGMLGLLLAFGGLKLLTTLGPENLPRIGEIGIDQGVLGFTFVVSLFTGVVFGLVPALQISRSNLSESLKEGGRSMTEGLGSQRIRSLLVVSEVALALVLLIGAGLMIKSFSQLQSVQPGFNPSRVLTMDIGLPGVKYPENHQVVAFFDHLEEKVASLPGVKAAAFATGLPFAGRDGYLAFVVEGRPPLPPEQVQDAQFSIVSDGYFQAMEIPLLKGRWFSSQDGDKAPSVALISQTMARRFFPDEDPIGKRVTLGDPQTGPWLTIVGIVGDTRSEGLDAEPYPQMYQPYRQNPSRFMTLIARTATDPLSLVGAVRSEVRSLDQQQPISNVNTLEHLLSRSVARPRFNMLLLGIFAVTALVLATVGIYGILSYSVSERTHEIGIRMALGAERRDVLKLVVGQGVKLAVVGVAIGLIGALVLTRLMEGLLFGVSATDPLTFVAISLLLTGVAIVAAYLPARRATRVDPMVALRYE
jgi:putative ABC transport system permease protein